MAMILADLYGLQALWFNTMTGQLSSEPNNGNIANIIINMVVAVMVVDSGRPLVISVQFLLLATGTKILMI